MTPDFYIFTGGMLILCSVSVLKKVGSSGLHEIGYLKIETGQCVEVNRCG